jgi:tetratricopeptide (TPR) repeat protein
MPHRAIAPWLLALALALAPLELRAAPPSDDAASAAQSAYEKGVAAYDTSDYEAAVELFRTAFESARKIEDEQVRSFVIAALWFNLARAQSKAYDIDRDSKRLRQAQDLIGKYLALNLDAAERTDAEAIQAEIERKLAGGGSEGGTGGTGTPPPDPQPTDGGGEGGGLDTSDPGSATDKPEPRATERRPGRGLILGGAVLAGVGVAAGAGLVGAGAGMAGKARDEFQAAPDAAGRDDATAKGATANALGVTGMVAGGVLLVGGVALIVVGVRKNKSAGRLAFSPTLHPRGGGFVLQGRF